MDSVEPESRNWEWLQDLEVDTAGVYFIDGAALDKMSAGADPILAPGHVQVLVGPYLGIRADTWDDGCYPIEVARKPDGTLSAVRVEYVTDVADVEGTWNPIGTVPITSGRLAVADLICARSEDHRAELPCPRGEHLVEIFHTPGDVLGARLTVEQ